MDESIMDVKFTYPIEDIDRIIQQLEQGIKPFGMTERMKLEVELRKRQLAYLVSDYIDETEEEDDISLAELHDRMTKEMEQARRKATTQKATFRKLSEAQRKQLEEEMESSVVRCDVTSEYHKSDEALYSDKEHRELMRKLGAVRQQYHDPISWANAMKLVIEGIQYSLKHDYPMGYEWAVKEFNQGRIKYLFGPIPKLFIGLGTKQITDKAVLKGILNGDVKVLSRDEEKEKFKREKRKRGNPINVDYGIVSRKEHEEAVRLHNMGYDTPLSAMLKSKSGLFDRLSMPFTIGKTQEPEDDALLQFDWTRDGAGREYYEKKNHIQIDHVAQFIQAVQEANDGKLTQSLGQETRSFLQAINHPEVAANPFQDVYQPLQPSERALEIEKSIMDRIRQSNVGIL